MVVQKKKILKIIKIVIGFALINWIEDTEIIG